jgi:periplasmic divalent cation tolerance protein
MKNELLLGYVTCPNLDVARKIAQHLVKNKVVACVNLIRGIETYYHWNEELCEDHEIILLAKFPNHLWETFQEQICALHPYECPAVFALPMAKCRKPFAQWIKESLLGGTGHEATLKTH